MIKIQSFASLPWGRARSGKVYSLALGYPNNLGVRNRVSCLAPTWKLVRAYKKRQIDEAEYTAQYRLLIKRRWSAVKRWLDSLDANCDMYLCCWERTGFCHRFLVAKLIAKYRPDIQLRIA